MVSTTGVELLPHQAVRQLREHLLPLTTILTPNVPEAKLILSNANIPFEDPQSVIDLIDMAKAIQSLGPKYVLLKGGHLPFRKDGSVASTHEDGAIVINILRGEGETTRIESVFQKSKNTHGTGCSLACAFFSASNSQVLADTNSCNCVEPRKWTKYSTGSEKCL